MGDLNQSFDYSQWSVRWHRENPSIGSQRTGLSRLGLCQQWWGVCWLSCLIPKGCTEDSPRRGLGNNRPVYHLFEFEPMPLGASFAFQ